MTTELICGITEGRCICVESPQHEGPHLCECGGSWEVVDGRFVVHAWPTEEQPIPRFIQE